MTRLLLALCACVLAAIGSSQANAQELLSNPFAKARALRAERGKTAKATLRLRYEASAEPKGGQQPGELVIAAASDWAEVRQNGQRTLYDFRLGRVIELQRGGTFVSRGLISEVAFRVLERENRAFLSAITRGAGGAGKWDACDAETELGVAIPWSKEPPSLVEAESEETTTTLRCNGRVVGVLESGEGRKAPAALWPVLAHVMTMHPGLRAAMAKRLAAPRRVEATFRLLGASKTLVWQLISAEPVSETYPLTANMVNATAASLNKIAPGLGDLAAAAVAGRATGGPPTIASWEARVGQTALEKGVAAATLEMWPALHMFPQAMQSCQTGTRSAICDLLRDMRRTVASDTAVRALLAVALAEQASRPGDAIDAMVAARSSPLADHPVLAASFALALQAGGPAMRKQAEAAGAPGEAMPLHVRALEAYPYNPAYWTDLGDYFARVHESPTAYLLYAVALSLPMPDAQRSSPVLLGKRSAAARLRSNFPVFFLAGG